MNFSEKRKKHLNKRTLLTVVTALVLCFTMTSCGIVGTFLREFLAEGEIEQNSESFTSAVQTVSSDKQSETGGQKTADGLYMENPQAFLTKSDAPFNKDGSAVAAGTVMTKVEVARNVKDSVVVIECAVSGGTSAGSGVIVSAQYGYILTCNHVISGATEVVVAVNSQTSENGRKLYSARIVGCDSTSDLAVLKIEPDADEPLTEAKQGKSDNLVVAEDVMAIGNPLGTLGGSVSVGIVSATDRQITTADGNVMSLIQTDAAINSGNSGGGLFNMAGELVGIVNAKMSSTGVEGLGFAIPIDLAYTVECDLIENGYRKGTVDSGLNVIYKTQYYGSGWFWSKSYTGLYVQSSRYNAEIHSGDMIYSLNGTAIKSLASFNAFINSCQIGDEITVVYIRFASDGSYKDYSTTITLREYTPN